MLGGGALPSGRPDRRLRVLIWGLLVLAVGYFGLRGVARAVVDSEDFGVGYGAARALIAGQNPYDVQVLKEDLLAVGGGDVAGGNDLDRLRNVYPPATIAMFLPTAPLEWRPATLTFLGINVAGTLFIALGLTRLLHWRVSDTRSLALTAMVLAQSPVHVTVASGQTAVVATALIVAAMMLEPGGHGHFAGLCYGLATAVKAQVGLPFIAMVAWRRRTAAFIGVLVIAILTAIVVARLAAAHVPWLESLSENFAALSDPGGINDPSPANPDGYSLINMQHVLLAIAPLGVLADVLTYLFVGLMGVLLLRFRGDGRRDRDLLAMSTVGVLGLLVTYHRYYDAVLLALPIAWGISALDTPRRRQGVLALVLAADFILPVQSAMHAIEVQGTVPDWLIDSVVWRAVIMTQHGWALILLAGVLLWAASASFRSRDRPAESGGGTWAVSAEEPRDR